MAPGGKPCPFRHPGLDGHEAVDVEQPGVHGVVGAEGGAEGQFALKLAEKQGHQAGAALLDRQVPGGVPQGHVRFAVLGVFYRRSAQACQGIQAEIGPQPVAVVIGLIRPEFAPEDVFLIAPQFLGSDIDFLEFLLCLEFRACSTTTLTCCNSRRSPFFKVTRRPKRVSKYKTSFQASMGVSRTTTWPRGLLGKYWTSTSGSGTSRRVD